MARGDDDDDAHLAVEPDDVAGRAVRALLVDLGRAAEAVDLAMFSSRTTPTTPSSADEDRGRSPTSIGTSRHSARSTVLAADEHDSWRGDDGGPAGRRRPHRRGRRAPGALVRSRRTPAGPALGYCYRKLERWPEAVALLQTAVDLDAGVAWYQQELDGRSTAPATSDAQEVYRRVLSTVDDGTWADRNLIVAGWCAFRLNRLTWAAAPLGRATPGDRELPEARRPRPRAATGGRVWHSTYNGAIDLLRKHADEARARAMLISARDDLLQARQEDGSRRTATRRNTSTPC